VLSGIRPASEGEVRLNGGNMHRAFGELKSRLGYVPQDDIVHGELTIERTLYYGAKLRLPADLRPEEVNARIEEVLAAVGLSEHRTKEVRRLSGGQRKRVSVALELLARPRALYLDEPTSGLDPALEGRMMTLFRDLAESGATVIVSTHVTQNLRMCDKVIWMAPGGHLVFFGSPAEALRHFHVSQFAEIYPLLESEESRARWAEVFKDSPAYLANIAPGLERAESEAQAEPAERPVSRAPAQARSNLPRQLFWLTTRYAEVLARDGPNLALLLLQAPAIGLAVLLLFTADIFALTADAGGDALRATMSLHILTASAIFLGASNAAREITKESAIYARERLVNLNVLPYVISKVIVLSGLCLFQAAVLVAIFAARLDLPGSDWGLYLQLLAAIFLTAVVGMAMGLLISAVSANSDRAMAIVPVSLIPQLVFAGALVAYDKMLLPAKVLSQLMISKWALQLTGSMTELSERFVAQFPASFGGPYANQFDDPAWPPWVVLGALFVAMLAATVLVQKRKDVL
jgi:ABC-type multidrug transport system ATPase subunit